MDRLSGIFISEFLQQAGELIVSQFPAVRTSQKLLSFGYGGIPLVHGNFPAVFPLLQPVIGSVVLHLGRRPVGLSLGLFAVSAHLAAGTFRLPGGDVVAVTGVVTGGQQEIFSAVVAAPWGIAKGKPSVELGSQKIC